MAQYPFAEVWWRGNALKQWSAAEHRVVDIGKAPYGPPHAKLKGKPFGQNAILPFARHRRIVFFDSNASVRYEEAIKLFMGMEEFKLDPSLGFLVFGENRRRRSSRQFRHCPSRDCANRNRRSAQEAAPRDLAVRNVVASETKFARLSLPLNCANHLDSPSSVPRPFDFRH